MNKIKTAVFAALTGLVVLTSFGCTEAKQLYDCAEICEQTNKCVGADKTQCLENCRKNESAADAEACNKCIEDNENCKAGAFACTVPCAKFVTK